MKKLLAIMLALILVLSLCACKKNNTPDPTPDNEQSLSGSTENSSDNNTENSNTESSSDVTDESTGDTSGDNAENNEDNSDSTPTCTHDWKAATCTAPKTCSKCSATEGSAAGHSWKAATCTAPKTCSVCGATEGNKGSHTFTADCTICGQPNADFVELGQSNWAFTIKRDGELILGDYTFFESVTETGANVGFTRYQTLAAYAAEMDMTVEAAREACQQYEGQLEVIDGAEYVYNGWGMDNYSDRRYKEENGTVTIEFLSLDWDENDNEVWTVEKTVVMKRTGMAQMTVTSSNYESTPVGTVLTGEYFGS